MNEADLPGIGKKFWLDAKSGEKVTVIRHEAGKAELYLFKEGEEFPSSAVTLQEDEARELATALFGQAERRIVETMDIVIKDMVIEWAKVAADSKLKGRSIEEMAIRRRTGASVIAIIRGERGIPSPPPDEVIQEDDMLLVIGDRRQMDNFKEAML